jgi:hypothetical protein
MQLFILTTLVSFLVASPSFDWWKDFDHDGDITGNFIHGAVHAPKNTCNNNVKNIGVGFAAFDNSCTNTAIEADTDDHSNSHNGWWE